MALVRIQLVYFKASELSLYLSISYSYNIILDDGLDFFLQEKEKKEQNPGCMLGPSERKHERAFYSQFREMATGTAERFFPLSTFSIASHLHTPLIP